MENRQNNVKVIAVIAILTLTTGCGITVTRNYYYSCPDKSIKELNKNKEQISNTTYLLINQKNGYN
jgi:hypothetical protein